MKNAHNPATSTPTETINILPREREAIMKSLAAGLVPNIGLHQLVVGRKREIQALTSDLDIVRQGGASFRIIVGGNGAGKTFLQHLTTAEAIRSGLVVLSADLSVNHRLHATDGRGRALYSSLLANVRTQSCPSGNGLRPLMESWISSLGFDLGSEAPTVEAMAQLIKEHLRPLTENPGGFDLAKVLACYYQGHVNDNPALQDAALRWLRAEYSTKTEAKHDLGVGRIINDEEIYPGLKLFADFCKLAGYAGVVVVLDELSALTHRLGHPRAREANVQVLLTIINDCFQGNISGLGFVLAGTPDALEDPARGLFSVNALRSRLQACAPAGHADYASPVLRVEALGREELLVLLHNVRRVHALGDKSKYRLPDEALERFLTKALSRFGRTVLANPREVLRPFVSVLNILDQDPGQRWESVMDRAVETPQASDPAAARLENLQLQ